MPKLNCCPSVQRWRSFAAFAAAGLVLLPVLPMLLAGPADAASVMTRATATVIEAVPVNGLLGTPVSVQDILEALTAPAGPATGGPPIKLPSLLPFGLAEIDAGSAAAGHADEARTVADAPGWSFSGGELQRGLVAAISAVRNGADGGADNGAGREAEQVSITVGFN